MCLIASVLYDGRINFIYELESLIRTLLDISK